MQPFKLRVCKVADGRIVWQSVRENELIPFRLGIESYTHAARHLCPPAAYHHFIDILANGYWSKV